MKTITARQLGLKIVEICGNEGQWPNNTAEERRSRELLQSAISYIPKAYGDTGADLSDTTFIFAIPGHEFAVKAGSGTWEFQFSYNLNEEIECQCANKPMYIWAWHKVSKNWEKMKKAISNTVSETLALTFENKSC